jgi:hypothetical protein
MSRALGVIPVLQRKNKIKSLMDLSDQYLYRNREFLAQHLMSLFSHWSAA